MVKRKQHGAVEEALLGICTAILAALYLAYLFYRGGPLDNSTVPLKTW